MGQTFSQKVLAVKSERTSVNAGEIVEVKPDYVMSHDNAAAIIQLFEKIGVEKVYDPGRIVIILDHCVPAATEEHAKNHRLIRMRLWFPRQQVRTVPAPWRRIAISLCQWLYRMP